MGISVETSLTSLNQTAAVLLAAAVVELFPEALLVDGRGTSKYFYYDFVFPFAFNSDFIPLIEERMRLILREQRAVRPLEMMPSNAAALMQHRKQHLAAERLMQIPRATVPMLQIGDFVAYCPEPALEELTIPFFKILEATGERAIRVAGSASLDKETLKAVSRLPLPSSQSHLKLASEMALCEPMNGSWVWRPNGEFLRHQLIELWRREIVKQNFNIISSPSEGEILANHLFYFSRFGTSKIAEFTSISNEEFCDPSLGLLSPKVFFGDRAHLFCDEEKLLEESISSLRFILKIPKILGFEFEIVLSVSSAGAQRVSVFQQALESEGVRYTFEKEVRPGILASIDLRFSDSLGRQWTGPYLSMPEGKPCVLAFSAFGSLERTCALLLEKGGRLPLLLAPQQVRILVANRKSDPYANEVCAVLRAQGYRAELENSEEKLKTRLYRAIVEKVPYVLLLGEREEKARTLTIRAYNESEEQILSLDEFCMRLKREIESGNSEFKN